MNFTAGAVRGVGRKPAWMPAIALSLLVLAAAVSMPAATLADATPATLPSQGLIHRTHPAASPTTSETRESTNPGYYSQVLLALGVVIALIFVLRGLGRRMLSLPGGTQSSQAMAVLSRMTLAPRQQVILLRIGRRVVVAANSGTQINSLCQITEPEEVAELISQTGAGKQDAVSRTFATLFGRSRRQFESEAAAPPLPESTKPAPASTVDPDLATTQAELGGLMEKVRGLSGKYRS